MKVLRHRKWTLCLVIICFLSFFAPFSLESDMDLGKIHKDTRKISAFVRFPVPETFSTDRNDIQDLQKRNESFLNQSHFFQMQCENLKQMLHEAEKRAGHSLKVTGILKWIIFGETVVLTACAGIMIFLLLSF